MPKWVVTCPECQDTFVYAEIGLAMMEQGSRDPFEILPKPPFPQNGEKRTCPNCKIESLYLPFHLFYREDARGQAS
jgi:hypothetical protein